MIEFETEQGQGGALTRTSCIDSSWLGALIAGLETTRQTGGGLRTAAAGEQVRMVLELSARGR